MALFRLSMKKVHANIKAKVAYIEREGKYSKGVKAEELREKWSGNMPTWAASSQDFWNDIEQEEKPGQVQARGLELCLPVELSNEEQKALVDEFCGIVLKKHAYTVAIHDSKDKRNPHVHIYFSERLIDNRKEPPRRKYCRQRTGYSKDRVITGGKGKEWLLKTLKEWEDIQNKALEKAGRPERVSRLTLEAQGINREAQIHVGYQDTNRYRRTGEKGARMRRNEAILERNRAYAEELAAAEKEVEMLREKVNKERAAAKKAAEEKAAAKKKEKAETAAYWARRIAEQQWQEAVKKAEDKAKKAVEEAAKKQPEPVASRPVPTIEPALPIQKEQAPLPLDETRPEKITRLKKEIAELEAKIAAPEFVSKTKKEMAEIANAAADVEYKALLQKQKELEKERRNGGRDEFLIDSDMRFTKSRMDSILIMIPYDAKKIEIANQKYKELQLTEIANQEAKKELQAQLVAKRRKLEALEQEEARAAELEKIKQQPEPEKEKEQKEPEIRKIIKKEKNRGLER